MFRLLGKRVEKRGKGQPEVPWSGLDIPKTEGTVKETEQEGPSAIQ